MLNKTYFRYCLLFVILPKYNASHKKEEKTSRFLDDLDDKEWHVSHLRDLELGQECKDETFADKAKRYRKTLKNDGALVEFVSSNAIPFNPYDKNRDKCKEGRFLSKIPTTNTSVQSLDNSTKIKNVEDGVKTATVTNLNINKDSGGEEKIVNKIQRRGEYQFSSVEYYDEVEDFDLSLCPDDVEVIELEMDQLRNYYVECEIIVEWRSLD